mmetsp:Transcript_72534/g.170034  ORF Transcript_72534/g.170034 Transcript_72534/m.170034 type:complete len:258 (-) Transcript_72534:98-871(-)
MCIRSFAIEGNPSFDSYVHASFQEGLGAWLIGIHPEIVHWPRAEATFWSMLKNRSCTWRKLQLYLLRSSYGNAQLTSLSIAMFLPSKQELGVQGPAFQSSIDQRNNGLGCSWELRRDSKAILWWLAVARLCLKLCRELLRNEFQTPIRPVRQRERGKGSSARRPSQHFQLRLAAFAEHSLCLVADGAQLLGHHSERVQQWAPVIAEQPRSLYDDQTFQVHELQNQRRQPPLASDGSKQARCSGWLTLLLVPINCNLL